MEYNPVRNPSQDPFESTGTTVEDKMESLGYRKKVLQAKNAIY
jgi:hypothetical protein